MPLINEALLLGRNLEGCEFVEFWSLLKNTKISQLPFEFVQNVRRYIIHCIQCTFQSMNLADLYEMLNLKEGEDPLKRLIAENSKL